MTPQDLIRLALRDAGVQGVGQAPSDEDMSDALAHLNMLLAQWAQRRWLVYHLIDASKVSTGAASYSIGPGGDFDVARPASIASAFCRSLQSTPHVDWPLSIIRAREDWNDIAVKSVGNVPTAVWLDSGYPSGTLYFWPVPASGLYELHVSVKAPLSEITDITADIALPPEYRMAMLYSLGVMLREAYQMPPSPGLVALARSAMETLRAANFQMPTPGMPAILRSRAATRYNIFSDLP